MIDEKTFLRLPHKFKDDIYIYPPLVNEIIGNDLFPIYDKLLTQSQEEIEDDFVEQKKDLIQVPTPFQYLFAYAAQSLEHKALVQGAITFFVKQDVALLEDAQIIVIGNLEELIANAKDINDIPRIAESEFFAFQNLVRKSLGKKVVEPPNPKEHPKIKAMKAKARYRDKIKAKNGIGISFCTSLISLCCMGIGITPLNIGELSYATVTALIQQWQAKDSYETGVRSLQAGADRKKVNPKFWIRNLEE